MAHSGVVVYVAPPSAAAYLREIVKVSCTEKLGWEIVWFSLRTNKLTANGIVPEHLWAQCGSLKLSGGEGGS